MKYFYLKSLLFTITGIVLAQDTINVESVYYRPSGALRIILGASPVYGARVGASIYITNDWSIEIARGAIMDFNFGGGEYAMTLSGIALNKYFLLKGPNAFIVSILYSYANVTDPSYEYTGNFTIVAPMVGLDHSASNGFGYFVRGGFAFASANYRKGSGMLAGDFGISWRFKLFSAP